MRRKSERAKASPSAKQAESVPRRTTRRNKKSPEKSITEEDSDNSSSHGTDSEKEDREVLPPKRTKRNSRTEKPTGDEVKVRPTRGKRKTSVRSNEANEDDGTSDAASRPDSIQEETVNAADEATASHDNGSNLSVKDDEDKANEANDNGDDGNDDGNRQSQTQPVDESQKKDERDSDVEMEQSQTKTTDYSDVVHVQAPKNSEVIPEEAGNAVENESTAESASSSNHKNELNDFSATDVVASNKTNNISERTDDATSKDDQDAADKKERKKYDSDAKRKSDADGSRESSVDRSSVKSKDADKHRDDDDHVKDDVDDNETEKENSGQLNAQKPIVRKRKWLSTKSTTSRKDEIAISSDSLKGLIPDVKPVPLSDINLESNSEPEIEVATNEIESESEEERSVTRTIEVDLNRRSEERIVTLVPMDTSAVITNSTRKVSIVPDTNLGRPPSPPKSSPSCILYITNLVRPFTMLQLRGLLSRTGKIVENGFWMDKIKSKCYVKFETEDEAVETRHALHGVQWPSSNPKCLNVDFGSESHMERAIASTNEDGKRAINFRDERGHHPWDRTEGERDKILAAEKPVREWDRGKITDSARRGREAEHDEHLRVTERPDRERERTERERVVERGSDRIGRRRSAERRKNSESVSPGRKYTKEDNEPPLRLLDDLFRKTKYTPCIYWLPLTPEQIAVKEEVRQKQLAEHQRRIDALKKERTDRGNTRGGDQGGRDHRRRGNSRGSRDRDRGDRRRR